MTAARSLIAPVLLCVAAACFGCTPNWDPCPGRDCSDVGGMAGSDEGTGGGGVAGGGSGGGGAAGTSTTPSLVVELSDCGDLGTTVADFEKKFFVMKCGSDNSSCHRAASPFGDFATAPLFSKLSMKKALFQCAGASIVDAASPSKSMLAVAVQPSPACPNGKQFDVTRRMPLDLPVLTAKERGCLESYLRDAAAGR